MNVFKLIDVRITTIAYLFLWSEFSGTISDDSAIEDWK